MGKLGHCERECMQPFGKVYSASLGIFSDGIIHHATLILTLEKIAFLLCQQFGCGTKKKVRSKDKPWETTTAWNETRNPLKVPYNLKERLHKDIENLKVALRILSKQKHLPMNVSQTDSGTHSGILAVLIGLRFYSMVQICSRMRWQHSNVVEWIALQAISSGVKTNKHIHLKRKQGVGRFQP